MAPKDKFFGNTCTLHDRLQMVVIEDSIGYKAVMQALLKELGLPFTTIFKEWCHRKDQEVEKNEKI
jgi:hypothetical protein